MSKITTTITIVPHPSPEHLQELNVFDWSIWSKEVSEFPWTYEQTETCYFLAGEAVVTPDGGKPVTIGKGDLVTFPAGMSCVWKINRAVKKHYRFS